MKMTKIVQVYLYISLHLAYIIYQNIQSRKERHMHISLNKDSNTESFADIHKSKIAY